MRKLFLFITAVLCIHPAIAQCGGMDIFIANYQSGSADAQENMQGRAFITALTQGLPPANNSGGFRIAIADWDYMNGWLQCNFPRAGLNYTRLFPLRRVMFTKEVSRILNHSIAGRQY